MPPKRQVVAANERKAAQEAQKAAKAQAEKDAAEAKEWAKGAKEDKKAEELRKKAEAAAKKAEREALLAAEEAELAKAKSSKTAKNAGPVFKKAIPTSLDFLPSSSSDGPIDTFAASGIDGALELLDLASKGTEATAATKAAVGIDRHAEKRMKSAWAAFEERELPILKAENPHLRLSQLKQQLQKKWKKSPDNPMNQVMNISYNATQEEINEVVQQTREGALEKMRV
ncbi:hypothetical protein HDV05_008572 [Chytridiales sp. JEL 0842]|nr:hypothetical protein HDV05_008572 [Chytridiales sp. JEL 0842]